MSIKQVPQRGRLFYERVREHQDDGDNDSDDGNRFDQADRNEHVDQEGGGLFRLTSHAFESLGGNHAVTFGSAQGSGCANDTCGQYGGSIPEKEIKPMQNNVKRSMTKTTGAVRILKISFI